MDTKVFLDTNIVLDILDDRRPFHADAVKLYQKIEDSELNGYISETVLATTDYILQKLATKEQRVSMFFNLLSYLEVLPCNTQTCIKSLQSNFSDFEDALLYQIALAGNLDYFITNDTKALKKLSLPGLPVITSKDFLNINK